MRGVSFRGDLRRFALALAAMQVVAYAVAPLLEGATEHGPRQAHVHNAGQECKTVILHEASTCLSCQLLSISAERAETASLPDFSDGRATLVELAASSAPRAPPLRVHTRAPPITLG